MEKKNIEEKPKESKKEEEKKLLTNIDTPRDWEIEESSKEDYIMFQSKKKSKTYKGQPDKEITVRKHSQEKDKWTAEFGQASSSQPLFDTKEEAIKEAQRYMRSYSLEKKALSTISPSHSTEQSDDNKQMAEEENQVANETKTVDAVENVNETESTDNANLEKELEETNKELAEVKAKMVELEKQLAKPEFKALQDTPVTKLKENNVTPLGLIG
jgi:hypothetical protein